MKLTRLMVLSSILVMGPILAGCSQEKAPENATIYEKLLYVASRPGDDKQNDAKRKPDVILAFSGIKPGMKVADLSAGGGYYTELLSLLVGQEGQVWMQNGPRFLSKYPEKVSQRLADNRLANVQRIDSEKAGDLKLPQSLDLVVLSNVFHDLYVPRENADWNADVDAYLTQIKNALKDRGKVLLIDHAAVEGSGSEQASTHHRIDQDFVIQLFEAQGFSLLGTSDALANPADDHSLKVFDSKIRGKTDRFVLLLENHKNIN